MQPKLVISQIQPITYQSQANQSYGGNTFNNTPLPIASQIHNQRAFQQQQFEQMKRQNLQQQQSFVYQVQLKQQSRFEQQEMNKQILKEEPKFEHITMPTKPWLGDDVYLVTFLLSMEIERLFQENNELLSVKESVDERSKGFNSIEEELKNTRQKIGEYEKQLILIESEKNKWKQKFQSLYDPENADLKQQNELQKKILIDKEIRELTARFISERNQLENENRMLKKERDQLQLKHSNVENIYSQLDSFQKQNVKLRSELENFRIGFDELDQALKAADELEEENIEIKRQMNDMRDQFLSNIFSDAQMQVEINIIENDNLQLKQNLAQNGQEFDKIISQQNMVENLNEELENLKNENRQLEEMLEQHQQY